MKIPPSNYSSLACRLAFILLVLGAVSCRAGDPFSGTWRITDARTLTGRPYTGTVRIANIGAVYELQWKTTAGNYRGLGLADGNTLCTGWGGKRFGVVLYKINGDGTLKARWTIPGANDAEGTEVASGGSPGEVAGDYSIVGTNPDGRSAYAGKLQIRQTGATYQLRWTIPGSRPYFGVGLKVGDSLHVGWGTGRDAYAVITYVFNGSSANGVWSIGGSDKTSIESLGKD